MNELFFIHEPENKTDMLPMDDEGLVCSICEMPFWEGYLNPKYKAPKSCPDLSHTYDGYRIASSRFRDFAVVAGYTGLRFDPLPGSPGFFSFRVEKVITLTRPPELKFEEFCPSCQRFVSIWGRDHVKGIIPGGKLPEGIYRSDFRMGYKRMMFYKLIVTPEVKRSMRDSKLRGVSFSSLPVEKSVSHGIDSLT